MCNASGIKILIQSLVVGGEIRFILLDQLASAVGILSAEMKETLHGFLLAVWKLEQRLVPSGDGKQIKTLHLGKRNGQVILSCAGAQIWNIESSAIKMHQSGEGTQLVRKSAQKILLVLKGFGKPLDELQRSTVVITAADEIQAAVVSRKTGCFNIKI